MYIKFVLHLYTFINTYTVCAYIYIIYTNKKSHINTIERNKIVKVKSKYKNNSILKLLVNINYYKIIILPKY